MTYKIVGDSCLDMPAEYKNDPHYQWIPLTLQVDDTIVVDDDTFDQKKFLELVANSPNCPKTACPSPELFKEACHCDEENIFIITLSEHLSGSYQSAVIGKQMYEEEYGPKNICVLSSHSASCGQGDIAVEIQRMCEEGLPFEEIVEKATKFRDEMKTYFVLESLDTLRKNGRLTGLQAFFATALNIKPVMSAVEGVIVKLDQARGINKALARMADIAVKDAGDTTQKRLTISHCNNPERAEYFKAEMEKRAQFKEITICETKGVATVYAADGGIIVGL